jgi:hypothetical protein
MDTFITRSETDRRDILEQSAIKRTIRATILEKDFWVCWTLKTLFESEELAPYLIFKGGTSLSKAYRLIERFSEDIDLVIDRNAPYVSEVQDPLEGGLSRSKQKERVKDLQKRAVDFVESIVFPKLKEIIELKLGSSNDWELTLDISNEKQPTIFFYYPKTLNYEGYVKPIVRLEFGARGGTNPHSTKPIQSYIAEDWPQLFIQGSTNLPILAAERTFWEKITLLHRLHHIGESGERESRHYYDIYMMSLKGVATLAIQNPALLQEVTQNKRVLFHEAKASYETAIIGTLKVVPDEEFRKILKKDYEAMNEMLMGDVPDFSAILTELTKLEVQINQQTLN